MVPQTALGSAETFVKAKCGYIEGNVDITCVSLVRTTDHVPRPDPSATECDRSSVLNGVKRTADQRSCALYDLRRAPAYAVSHAALFGRRHRQIPVLGVRRFARGVRATRRRRHVHVLKQERDGAVPNARAERSGRRRRRAWSLIPPPVSRSHDSDHQHRKRRTAQTRQRRGIRCSGCRWSRRLPRPSERPQHCKQCQRGRAPSLCASSVPLRPQSSSRLPTK